MCAHTLQNKHTQSAVLLLDVDFSVDVFFLPVPVCRLAASLNPEYGNSCEWCRVACTVLCYFFVNCGRTETDEKHSGGQLMHKCQRFIWGQREEYVSSGKESRFCTLNGMSLQLPAYVVCVAYC